MCIEYNECHYGGMYNVYVKIIFVITEIVRRNEKTGTGVRSEKEKVKESQSRSVTPSLDTHFGCRFGGVTVFHVFQNKTKLRTKNAFSLFSLSFLFFKIKSFQ